MISFELRGRRDVLCWQQQLANLDEHTGFHALRTFACSFSLKLGTCPQLRGQEKLSNLWVSKLGDP